MTCGCNGSIPRCVPCRTIISGQRSLSAGRWRPPTGSRAAVQEAKIGADKDIPHVTVPIIVKYITDLQLLGLL
jgi:thioester reductase-like protein